MRRIQLAKAPGPEQHADRRFHGPRLVGQRTTLDQTVAAENPALATLPDQALRLGIQQANETRLHDIQELVGGAALIEDHLVRLEVLDQHFAE
ncbi:hypothetical protein BH24ACT19_BH24ACT19_08160 [soil metagenome]